jgi:hypothetical protein
MIQLLSTDNARPPVISFKLVAVEDRDRTIADGMLRYKDTPFVNVRAPGSKDSMDYGAEDYIRNKREAVLRNAPGAWPMEWLVRLEEQYKAWLSDATSDVVLSGTHIKNWPNLTPSEVQNLLGLGLKTIEDVANMNSQSQANYGLGAVLLKQKAETYLRNAEDSGKMVEEVAALRVALEEAKTQIADLRAAATKAFRNGK